MSIIHFPNCKLHDIEQRTDEWFSLRKGALTASEFGVWLAEKPKVRLTIKEMNEKLSDLGILAPKGSKHGDLVELLPNAEQYASLTQVSIDAREKMIAKKLSQIAGCDGPPEFEIDPDGPPPRNPSMWAIWNGIVLEPEAREEFMKLTKLEVEECGFALHDSGRFGCSPDGLIKGTNRGLEMKCPLSTTHIKYLRKGGLPDEYKAQVHGSMASTGADSWWFFSYCPGLPPFKLLVERDQFTEDMLAGLNGFASALDLAQSDIARMWDEAYPEGRAA